MRILFDGQQLSQQMTGVGHYTDRVLRALLAHDRSHYWLVLCHSRNADYVRPIVADPSRATTVVLQDPPPLDFRVQQEMLRKLLPEVRADLYFSPSFLSAPRDVCPSVSVVHDVTYVLYPEFHPAGVAEYLHRCVADTCRNASRLIAVSENSRRDVTRIYHFPESRIAVVPHAADPAFFQPCQEQEVAEVRRRLGVPERYVLAVNMGNPKKNVQVLLRALARVSIKARSGVKLVIAGEWSPEALDIPALVSEVGLDDEVVLTGYVSQDDLRCLYAGAQVFCFPSLHEGFGLPVLEAMASGVPVISSDAASLPEVAGDAARMVPPVDEAGWAAALSELLTSEGARAQLIERGRRRARRFSWEQTAKNTLAVLEEAPCSMPGKRERSPDHVAVAYRADWLSPSGFGEAARLTFRCLEHAGLRPHAVAAPKDGIQIPALWPRDLHAAPRRADVWLHFVPPEYYDLRPPVRHVAQFVWETDRLPAPGCRGLGSVWVTALNSLDEVWVPAQFLESVLADSGVSTPVHVLPIPIDVETYAPGPQRPPPCPLPDGFDDSWTVFLYVGTWDQRKRPDILLRAFCRAFDDQDRALLLVKSYAFGHPARDQELLEERLAEYHRGSAHVAAIGRVLPEADMVRLYQFATVFATASRGEGYCLPAVQAMACGKPVVAIDWSAFVGRPGVPVRHDLTHVPPGVALPGYAPDQRWAEIDEEDLAAKLRWAHDNREELSAVGRQARHWVLEHASCDVVGRACRERLRALGASPARAGKEGPAVSRSRSAIALAVLLGDERDNVVPFLWSFRGWPGELVVLDDNSSDGSAGAFARAAAQLLDLPAERVRIIRRSIGGNFGGARNLLHELTEADWVLHADLDERWDPSLIAGLPGLLKQLDRDGKLVCGFPRANFLDGVLVNDVPDIEWTPAGLARAASRVTWPPRNPDVQFRLVRAAERWREGFHETPLACERVPGRVAAIDRHWVLHVKSLVRQQRQDLLYRSYGQTHGMPQAVAGPPPPPRTLREAVLSEALDRLPAGRLTVVETGTLRDPSPQAREGDGWSTLWLARLLARRPAGGSHLYSIDIEPEHIAIAKRAVPAELHPWVTWLCADSRKALASLDVERIDLLYLDSGDDPALILSEFEVALPKLGPQALVVVDDTGPRGTGGKGALLVPEADRRGWRVEHRIRGRSGMAILMPPATTDSAQGSTVEA